MKKIIDRRIRITIGGFIGTCVCGKSSVFKTRASTLKMLERGSCRNCKKDYTPVNNNINIYKRDDGKWCSRCSGCDKEQAYTRMDHAKQSSIADWQCKECVGKSKRFSNNLRVGNKTRLFNRFKKSSDSRLLKWDLTEEEVFASFNGKCALTNWDISIQYGEETASLDRINSNYGYVAGNIQWVHTMVNMSKNKYSQESFIEMCKAVVLNLEK
jgi:hypothetical protein